MLFLRTSATEFSPDANMTRASLATVLWRLESNVKADGGIDFTDVPNNVYYTDAVEWASANHVIEGTAPGLFSPLIDVTRQEMVTMIYRYVRTLGMDTGDTVSLAGFRDSGKMASWAEDAMEWAVANGIIQGKDNSRARTTALSLPRRPLPVQKSQRFWSGWLSVSSSNNILLSGKGVQYAPFPIS